MNIIIASERKNIINSIRLLLEIEINEIIAVSGASNIKELVYHINNGNPDMIIVSEDFLDEYEKVMDNIYHGYPKTKIVIISGSEAMEKKQIIADKYITNESIEVIDNLINLARCKKEKLHI